MMKSTIGFLLILLGGVIAGFNFSTFSVFPAIAISLVGGFLVGFSYILFTSVYSGNVWGIKIKASNFSMIKVLIGFVGLIIGGFSICFTALTVFVSLFSGEFITMLINLIGFVLMLVVGPLVGKVFLEKTLAKEKNASVLGQIQIFRDIDANINHATNFVVGFEGVALFSSTNYCYAVYLYENYQLGTLTTPQEVALVGTYFVQKYSDKFTYKVDVEVIPGTPGQTVVAVGTGGIGIARIQGTPDKRIFRSYIFKRK